jgi:hypothetical protein
MSVLSIHLIRHDNVAFEDSDDKIKIRPIMDLFHVSFITSRFTHFMYCTRDEALRYVADLLYLLPADRDPYRHIQFNFPCYPSLIYQMGDLTNLTINVSIQERLKALFDNWPEARPPAPVQRQRQEQRQDADAISALLSLATVH